MGWPHQCADNLKSPEAHRIYPKKKTYGYWQRDEQQRQAFRIQLSTLTPEQVVYADESGMDNRADYGYGYAPKGERIYALKSGRREGRINMIAAWCNRQLLAPFRLEGSCNRAVFEMWLERCLIPALRPGQVLVVDNATFHKGGHIAQLLQEAGCQLWYLPPYSPDLNQIEHCWAWIKARVHRCKHQFESLRDAIDPVLRLAS